MRTLLTQGHADNLRDLILNYGLDKPESSVIDFTFGKGGLWKTEYPYKLQLTKCDADPSPDLAPGPIKKDLTTDDYSDLGLHDAAVFDPPYLYGHQVFNYQSVKSAQKQGPNSWGNNPKFSENKNQQQFIERVQALNRVAPQCLKKGALLFVKVMDPRDGKGNLALNHVHLIQHLTNFECYAIFVYMAGGAHTWKNHAELSHGYWMTFRMVRDSQQNTLPA